LGARPSDFAGGGPAAGIGRAVRSGVKKKRRKRAWQNGRGIEAKMENVHFPFDADQAVLARMAPL